MELIAMIAGKQDIYSVLSIDRSTYICMHTNVASMIYHYSVCLMWRGTGTKQAVHQISFSSFRIPSATWCFLLPFPLDTPTRRTDTPWCCRKNSSLNSVYCSFFGCLMRTIDLDVRYDGLCAVIAVGEVTVTGGGSGLHFSDDHITFHAIHDARTAQGYWETNRPKY